MVSTRKNTKTKTSTTKKNTSKPRMSEDTYWRVTIVVGFKTYGKGSTEEDAINDVYNTVKEHPPIEEYMYQSKLINGKAVKPMSHSEILQDPNW